MAVQIEARGQIQDFLDVLRRRLWLVVVPAVFGIVIGTCLATVIPRKFLAKTQLELRQIGPTNIAKEGQNAKFQILAPARIKKVVEELKPPAYLALEEVDRREFLNGAQRNLSVRPDVGGNQSSIFITILYTHVDRIWAGTFLRALRDDWKDDVLEQDRNKLKDEKMRLGQERDKLEKQLEKEEQELADLKKEHGISATQPIPGAASGLRAEDPDYTRLQDAKTQLFKTGLELETRKADTKRLEQQYAEMPEKITKESVVAGKDNEEKIQALQTEILTLNEKLSGYGKAHSRYQKLLSEIESKERQKAELEGLVTRSQLTSTEVKNPDKDRVRAELDKNKSVVAGLEGTRKILSETIDTLERKMADLSDIYRQVRERETKIMRVRDELKDADRDYQAKVRLVELGEGPRSNPFAILEEINVPPKPTEPNPLLVIAVAVMASLGIGVGLAVLLEYSKSCFRSVYDISRVMVVPVLGNINTIVTAREARMKRTRRVLVGSASFLFLGSLCFVTWAWAENSELLSPSLRSAIEGLRSALK